MHIKCIDIVGFHITFYSLVNNSLVPLFRIRIMTPLDDIKGIHNQFYILLDKNVIQFWNQRSDWW